MLQTTSSAEQQQQQHQNPTVSAPSAASVAPTALEQRQSYPPLFSPPVVGFEDIPGNAFGQPHRRHRTHLTPNTLDSVRSAAKGMGQKPYAKSTAKHPSWLATDPISSTTTDGTATVAKPLANISARKHTTASSLTAITSTVAALPPPQPSFSAFTNLSTPDGGSSVTEAEVGRGGRGGQVDADSDVFHDLEQFQDLRCNLNINGETDEAIYQQHQYLDEEEFQQRQQQHDQHYPVGEEYGDGGEEEGGYYHDNNQYDHQQPYQQSAVAAAEEEEEQEDEMRKNNRRNSRGISLLQQQQQQQQQQTQQEQARDAELAELKTPSQVAEKMRKSLNAVFESLNKVGSILK